MQLSGILKATGIATLVMILSSCATLDAVVSAPGVSLREVEVTELAASGQTLVLGFDVANPNPFPLPVSRIDYGLDIGGYRLASGQAATDFTVPARGDGGFSISVELDLLKTAPALLHVVKDSIEKDVPYRLEGEFGVDLPYARPIAFRNEGEIRLRASGLRAQMPWLP